MGRGGRLGARRVGGPEIGVGTQTQKKGGGPKWRGLKGGGPKGAFFFFFFSRSHFHSFFSLSLSWDLFVSFFFSLGVFSCFFSLSGGLLVEFWLCFEDRGPQMCLFSPSGCRVEAPGGLQATKNTPREDPQREEKTQKTPRERKKDTRRHLERGKEDTRGDPQRKNENGGGRRKKTRNFGRSGGGRSGGHGGPAAWPPKIGQAKAGGQSWPKLAWL